MIDSMESSSESIEARVGENKPKNPGVADAPRLALAISAMFLLAVFGYGTYFYVTVERHHLAEKRLRETVDGLRTRCPKELTRRQWDFMTGWTQNAIGNCFGWPKSIYDHQRFARMPDEIEKLINDESGVSVIDWIWDEMEANSTYGVSYSERWRPTRPDRLEDAEVVSF